MIKAAGLSLVVGFCVLLSLKEVTSHGDHAFAKIGIYQVTFALTDTAYVKACPTVLGSKNQNSEWVTVSISNLNPSIDDWIGVFSPANFSDSTCFPENPSFSPPYLCSAPIKVVIATSDGKNYYLQVLFYNPLLIAKLILQYQYANYTNPDYKVTGEASLKLQLINQRSDFSFALFTGGLSTPTLVAVSNTVTFANPNSPSYPRLAQGKMWDEMTVTWTSGYGINEAQPLVEWGQRGGEQKHSSAGTLTFDRHSMCGAPARTVGWRDPGYIHTSFLKDLWPNQVYTYKLGHKLLNGTIIWSMMYQFKSSPYPGQDSLQRVIIFGDMGKDEADGSNEYNNFQPGSLNTTKQLIDDLENFDIVFHIGDICYANGYLSQWDQFTAQIEPIASAVPYMIASGNHERDWPNSGSFYGNTDSGGECGVVARTMFYAPTDNRDKLWYSTDYGMFRFCIADTEHDWREGTEQYKFIEQCLASVDRQKQPWLIFIAHRVLGYSSALFYAVEGSFGEPMGRDSLQKLWQKYKVDIAIYGHVHNYERTCPVYENICVNDEKDHYKGSINRTIHVVAGGGGADLAPFVPFETTWSIFRDYDYGFLKLTAYNHSALLFEYKKSSDGQVHLTNTSDTSSDSGAVADEQQYKKSGSGGLSNDKHPIYVDIVGDVKIFWMAVTNCRLNYVVIRTRISEPVFKRAIETSSDGSDVFTRVQRLDQLIKDVKELCSFGCVQTVNKFSCFGDVALAIGEHFEKYVPYAMPMMQGVAEGMSEDVNIHKFFDEDMVVELAQHAVDLY
ncbi:probable inactive purple acid phosphatase 1 [Tanacetum coccineum]